MGRIYGGLEKRIETRDLPEGESGMKAWSGPVFSYKRSAVCRRVRRPLTGVLVSRIVTGVPLLGTTRNSLSSFPGSYPLKLLLVHIFMLSSSNGKVLVVVGRVCWKKYERRRKRVRVSEG